MPRPHCFLHENPKFAANQPQNFAMRRARIQRDSSRAARRVNRKAAARLLSASRQAQRRTPRVRFARADQRVNRTAAARLLSASRQACGAHPRVRFARTARRVNRKAAARLFSASRQAQRRAVPRSLRPRSPARQSQSRSATVISASRQAQRRTSPRSLRPRRPARQSQSRSAVTFRIATGTAAHSPRSLRPRSPARQSQGRSAVILRIATGTAAHIPAFALSAQFSASIARPQRGYFRISRQAQRRAFPRSLRPRSSARQSQGRRAVILRIATGTAAQFRIRFVRAARRVNRKARRGYFPHRDSTAAHIPASASPRTAQHVNRMASMRLFSAPPVSTQHLTPRIRGAIWVFCRLDAFFRHLVP